MVGKASCEQMGGEGEMIIAMHIFKTMSGGEKRLGFVSHDESP